MSIDFDIIAAAEVALQSGTGYRETIQRYAMRAKLAGRLKEFDNLVAGYDQNSARIALHEWHLATSDREHRTAA